MNYNIVKGDNNMVENIIDKISFYVVDNILCKDEELSEEKREVMLFGVTRIVEDVPKYLAIFIIGVMFNVLKYIGIVLLVNLLYKTFIGGAHARNNITCFFSSIAIFILPVGISILVDSNPIVRYVLAFISFITGIYIIIKIAPADTEEVPILKKYRRNRMKVMAFISLSLILIITLIYIKSVNAQEIVLLSLLEINLFATNTAYKLYGCKHSYESEEFKKYYNS